MTKFYILDNVGNPIPITDVIEWSKWMHDNRRSRKRTAFTAIRKDIYVSTLFIGIGHEPFLWETMVFGGKYDQEQERHASVIDAIHGHVEWVDKVLEEFKEDD